MHPSWHLQRRGISADGFAGPAPLVTEAIQAPLPHQIDREGEVLVIELVKSVEIELFARIECPDQRRQRACSWMRGIGSNSIQGGVQRVHKVSVLVMGCADANDFSGAVNRALELLEFAESPSGPGTAKS